MTIYPQAKAAPRMPLFPPDPQKSASIAMEEKRRVSLFLPPVAQGSGGGFGGGGVGATALRMGQGRFIDEQVEVESEGFGVPRAFVWQGERHEVVEVLSVRRRLDFKRAWWRRRHRDYFRVRTREGRVFELYHHRGPGRRYWVLLQELASGPSDSG